MDREIRDLRKRIEELDKEVTELEKLLAEAEIRTRLSKCYKRLTNTEIEVARKDKTHNLNDVFLEMLICN